LKDWSKKGKVERLERNADVSYPNQEEDLVWDASHFIPAYEISASWKHLRMKPRRKKWRERCWRRPTSRKSVKRSVC